MWHCGVTIWRVGRARCRQGCTNGIDQATHGVSVMIGRAIPHGKRPELPSARQEGDTPKATPHGFQSLALRPQMDELEHRLIEEALASAGNNKAAAARLLEISERVLWYKIRRYELG